MADAPDPAKAPEKSDKKATKPETAPGAATAAKADAKAAEMKSSDGSAGSAKASKSGSVPGSTSASSAPANSSRGGGGRGVLVAVVVIALLIGAGYATRAVWMPNVEPYLAKIPGLGQATTVETESSDPLDQLSDHVAELERKVDVGTNDAMAALTAEKQRVSGELTKALQRIDDLEQRLSEVRDMASALTGPGATVDLSPVLSRMDGIEETSRAREQEIAALSEKLDTLASTPSATKGQGVLLAVAQLRDAALSGRPYAAQLTAMTTLAGNDADLKAAASRLAAHAESGLPTNESLTRRYSDIAGTIVAEARAGSDDWLHQAAGKLSALVALRRTDGKSGDPLQDAVAKIEKNLQEGDIAAAVETASVLSDTLPPSAQKTLEPWLIDAKARASAVRSLDAMHAATLAGLDGK